MGLRVESRSVVYLMLWRVSVMGGRTSGCDAWAECRPERGLASAWPPRLDVRKSPRVSGQRSPGVLHRRRAWFKTRPDLEDDDLRAHEIAGLLRLGRHPPTGLVQPVHPNVAHRHLKQLIGRRRFLSQPHHGPGQNAAT